MNADMKWLDNPEVFRVNQLDAHSDHCYYMDYADMEKSENPLMQSLNGQWEFAFSKNVMDRPENFYEENFDASSFDKIMVPGHIELAGYDKIRYINTMYPWEGNICLDCGFESQRTFNRVFKDRYKITPREYRKRMEHNNRNGSLGVRR